MIITVVFKLFYDWPIYIFQYFVCILVTVLFGQGLRKRPGTEKAEEAGETETAEEAKEVEDDVVDPKMCIEFVLGPPRDQRLASITELYCDDEFSTSLPENNIHLTLSDLRQPLHYHDQQFLTGKYLLPFSLPSGLQDSLQDVLQESSLDWCEGSHL